MTAPVIPTDAAGLEETLLDKGKMKAIYDSDGLGEFVKRFAAASNAKNQIPEQVKVETERVLADFFREHGADMVKRVNLAPGNEAAVGGFRKGAAYNPEALGASLDQLFGNKTSDFLRTIWHANGSPTRAAAEMMSRLRNDYASTIPESGGFTIPESLRSTLLQTSLEGSIVRPRAMVVPMDSLRVPFPTIDSTTNAGSVHGGMVAYWTEESAQLVESEAKFGRVVLEARKLTGYSEVPNELFTDSILAFSAFLEEKWPQTITFFEDVAFFSGTGVGEPLGFLNAGNTAAVEVAKESGQAADTILWENIVSMFARMLPSSLGKAVWIANINTFRELATMALSVGTGGAPVWLNNGVEGPPMTILGRPVIFTEKAPTLGDAGDINFVDLSYYLIGDRQQMIMSTSPHYKFQHDQTAVRIIQRCDGKPWLQNAITPAVGADTLSAFVKTAARA